MSSTVVFEEARLFGKFLFEVKIFNKTMLINLKLNLKYLPSNFCQV